MRSGWYVYEDYFDIHLFNNGLPARGTLSTNNKINYLDSALTEDRSCDDIIRSCIGIVVYDFQKISNVLISLETKKNMLNSYVKLILLYVKENWIISSNVKMRQTSVSTEGYENAKRWICES